MSVWWQNLPSLDIYVKSEDLDLMAFASNSERLHMCFLFYLKCIWGCRAKYVSYSSWSAFKLLEER